MCHLFTEFASRGIHYYVRAHLDYRLTATPTIEA
jgi:hypothetical protein